MSTVWVTGGAVDMSALAPGDYVLRRVSGDQADLGRMGEGGMVWFERLPLAALVTEAAADLATAGDLVPGTHQPELLTAVRGVETAVLARGG